MRLSQALLLSAAAINLSAATAMAADTRKGSLEEVIVTAQRRQENLQRTPVSVTSLSAKTINQLNITSADKISQLVPNVSVVRASGDMSGASAFIRGIGQQDPLLTVDSGVGQYLDGVYLGRLAANNFDLLDIARIEVLRGPQGTLYGRNTTGGAINTVTRTPGHDFSVTQKVGYGSYNDWYSRTRVDTGDLGESGLRGSINFMHHARDGYTDTPNTSDSDKPGAIMSNAVFAKLRGEWDKLTMDLSVDYAKDRGQREPFQITAPYTLDAAPYSPATAYFSQSPSYGGDRYKTSPDFDKSAPVQYPGTNTNEVGGVSATLSYNFSPALTVKSISAYRRWRSSTPTTYAGNLRGPVFSYGPPYYSIQAVSPFFGTQASQQYQYSQELQALGTIGSFNYVGGLYYFHERVNEYNPNYFTIVLPPDYLGSFGLGQAGIDAIKAAGIPLVGANLGQLLQYASNSTSYAAYGQTTYRPEALDRKFSVTVGLRGTYDHRTLDQGSVGSALPVFGSFADINSLVAPNGPSREGDASYRNLSYAVSADYQWTPTLNTYGRISSGYKAGGFNPRATSVFGQTFEYTFNPERVTAYEVGLKSEWFDHRLRANASAFYTNYKSLQVASYTGANGFTPNADAHIQGGELEVLAMPIDGVRLDASWGYTDAVYDTFNLVDPSTGIISNYARDSHFQYVPRNTIHAGAQYSFPYTGLGTVVLRTDFSHVSTRYFFPNTLLNPHNFEIRDPGQDLLSARIILSDVKIGKTDLEFQLYGDNLLDDERRDSGIDFGSGLGIAGNSFGLPRTFGISAEAKF